MLSRELDRVMKYSVAIKTLRKRMLVTQSELADILGVSFASVNRWENNEHEPTMKIKRKLANLFKEHNISIEE